MGFAEFKGSNSIKASRSLFNERGKYNNEGVPPRYLEKYPGVFRNFWFIENMYYGRINRNHQFIIPKQEKIRQLNGVDGKTIFLFDFVAHAVEDFLKEHDKALRASKIQKNDEFLSEMSVQKGYTSVLKEYDLHMNRFGAEMHKKVVRNSSKINNFDDFIAFLLQDIFTRDQIFPLTLTGFVSSRYSSPLNTGLFCDLTTISYDEDADKVNLILNKPNYEFFIRNSLKRGFLIDYNIPTRICANLGSREMESYMALYNTTSETIFNDYYDSIYGLDHVYLFEYFKKFYNKFVKLRRNIKKEETLNKEKNIIRRYNLRRNTLSTYELENRYDGKYRIDLYVDIRNYETGYRYDSSSIDLIKRVSQDYLENTSLERSLDYIDYQFIGFLNDSGAFNAMNIYKDSTLSGEEISGQSLRDRLNASVRESRKTFY